MKKCPPGVICIENISMGFICLIVIIFVIVAMFFIQNNSKNNDKIIIEQKNNNPGSIPFLNQWLPSWPYNNFGGRDVLLDPYAAPYRDERYLVPINVSTNIGAVPESTAYRQMGIITPVFETSKNNILPLMGRPLFTNRNKWQYYTISNQHNNVKLPIIFKGRKGLNDYGVDQIFSGDAIYVEGYDEAFRVTMYENDTIKYLPFI